MTDGTKLRGLSTVRVSKKFLLDTLRANRVEHEKSWNEIMDARQKKMIEDYNALYEKIRAQIDDRIEKVKADRDYHPEGLSNYINAPMPENHTKDYDKVISLIDASLDEEFELNSTEFNQYVNDDWSWKEVFTTTSGCYLPLK